MRWGKRKSNSRWPEGIPRPCIPTIETAVPTGEGWFHEIKHDGFRLMVRKEGAAVSIITRGGYDFTQRYPLIVASAKALTGSFIIDGEGVVCRPDGVADFALMQSRQHDTACFLYAFDLVALGSKDLRDRSLDERKSRLKKLLALSKSGIVYSEHVETSGDRVFAAACKMGLEGIVSKRRDRPYVSGPCKHWIKVKNPDAPWKKRLEERPRAGPTSR